MVAPITDHVDQALGRLLEQSKNRPNVVALLTALVAQIQRIENQLAALPAGTQLFGGGAYGAQLDGLGALVGLPRNGLPDSSYRLLITGKVAQNNSDATTDTLRGIATTCFGAATATINGAMSAGHAHREAPAVLGVEVGAPSTDPSLYPLCIAILTGAVAAAVALSWVCVHAGPSAFALAGPDDGLGFDDLNAPGQGGQLASIIYTSAAA